MKIERGNIVKDMVTGFTGMVTARVVCLNGCVRFCVVPRVKEIYDAKMPEGEYIDEGGLEWVREGVTAQTEQGGKMWSAGA